MIKNAACDVDDYVGSGEWSAGILAPNYACDNSPFNLNSIANPPIQGWGFLGNPPYSYQWHLSCNPDFASYQDLGTLPTETVFSQSCGTAFWIRLTITSADGAVIIEKKKISVVNCLNNPGTENRDANSGFSISENDVQIFPNPASTNITIGLPAIENAEWEISIIDQLGKSVLILPKTKSSSIDASIANFPPALYHVFARNSERVFSKKFTISN